MTDHDPLSPAPHDGHSPAARRARGGGQGPKIEGVEKRGQGYYAAKDVPRRLQAAVGKRRLVRSLETRDWHVAKARRHKALAEFQQIIDRAARDSGTAPEVEAGLAWRERFDALRAGDPALLRPYVERLGPSSRLDENGLTPAEAAAGEHLEDLFSLEEEAIAEALGASAAETFRGLAHGQMTPVLLDIGGWLAEGGTSGDTTDRTKRQYRSDLAALDRWLRSVGVVGLEGVTKKVAGRYVTEALLGSGTHRTTANRKISAPSSYWRWLVKRGHAEANPWAGQSLAKGADRGAVEKPKRPFTAAEVATLLSDPRLAGDPELSDACHVAALSGLRLDEIYRLTVEDCVGGEFNVRVSKSPAGVRRVPIHSELAALVARRTANKPAGAFLFHEAGPHSPKRERSAALSKRFGRYRQKVGVHERADDKRHSRVDFHSWRRRFITEARNAGHDLAVVAAIAGHERAGMTDGTYSGGPTTEMKRAAVEAVQLPAGLSNRG